MATDAAEEKLEPFNQKLDFRFHSLPSRGKLRLLSVSSPGFAMALISFDVERASSYFFMVVGGTARSDCSCKPLKYCSLLLHITFGSFEIAPYNRPLLPHTMDGGGNLPDKYSVSF